MSVIQVLDQQTANLIAAGEVVDRPASVVKELLENAIDSGADKITAEIRNGGTTLIRITDNGCGMTKEDASLCVKRHATSKLHTPEELFSISTLGFRGEALAAISSVSLFTIITKRAEDPLGTKFQIEGDEVLYYDDFGCPDGTTVMVEQLFRNQPARQKFLKRDATEAAAVLQYVQRIAVSHPDISFTFHSNGELKLQTKGDGDLKTAIYSVYGKEFASSLTLVQGESEAGITVSGYITRPDASRANRSCQNFYINKRFVKSKTMLFALEDAYKSYMKSDRFPGCVLNLGIDCTKVDVNVHPAKLEVRFSDERTVYNAVYFAVKNALKSEKTPLVYESTTSFEAVERFVKQEEVKHKQVDFSVAVPKLEPYKPLTPVACKPTIDNEEEPKKKQESKPSTEFLRTDQRKEEAAILSQRTEVAAAASSPSYPRTFQAAEPSSTTIKAPDSPQSFIKTETYPPSESVLDRNGTIIGIAFDTFILYQCKDALYFIDKHAAHERILYEKIKQSQNDNSIQLLIDPITVTLSTLEYSALEYNLSSLEKCGFIAEPFGSNEFKLRGIPLCLSHLPSFDIAELFIKMADDLANGGRIQAQKEGALDKIMYSMACKAAMKAGIKDSPSEYRAIVEELIQIENIVVCPHGRPIITKMTQKQLERLFLRN